MSQLFQFVNNRRHFAFASKSETCFPTLAKGGIHAIQTPVDLTEPRAHLSADGNDGTIQCFPDERADLVEILVVHFVFSAAGLLGDLLASGVTCLRR
jgi:hypothetical protein